MATITLTIPNTGPVLTVLRDLATREGLLPANPSGAQIAAGIQLLVRNRLRAIYSEQAAVVARDQALATAETTVATDAENIT